MTLKTREFNFSTDYSKCMQILKEVIIKGEALEFEENTSEDLLKDFFFSDKYHCQVCTGENDSVVGFYTFKPNHFGRGAHVANAGYVVDPGMQGNGIGSFMAKDSLVKARNAGFNAMQFNFVISTNTAAVELWKKTGFNIIATIPKGFRHDKLGYVDAYIMHRFL
jgi:ribosomal protein S18 acetylase RimI-like enzyme